MTAHRHLTPWGTDLQHVSMAALAAMISAYWQQNAPPEGASLFEDKCCTSRGISSLVSRQQKLQHYKRHCFSDLIWWRKFGHQALQGLRMSVRLLAQVLGWRLGLETGARSVPKPTCKKTRVRKTLRHKLKMPRWWPVSGLMQCKL